MSRVAPTSEKVLAVAGVFNALAGELEGRIDLPDPRVQAALLMVSTDIAMRTDTRDMGILAGPPAAVGPRIHVPHTDYAVQMVDGQRVITPLPGQQVIRVHDDGSTSDHHAYPNGDAQPCDDCGAMPGELHNLDIEH